MSPHPLCARWMRGCGADGIGCIAEHDGCAVVLCNGGEGYKRMELGKEHAGEKYTDILGWKQGEVIVGDDGWAEFRCNAMSVSIWVKVRRYSSLPSSRSVHPPTDPPWRRRRERALMIVPSLPSRRAPSSATSSPRSRSSRSTHTC